jgi:DNA-binding ferritin-like protein
VHRSLASLLHELAGAAHTVTRRLSASGLRDARRVAWKRASAHLRGRGASATRWERDLIDACEGCAVRLCALFRAATELADRASTRLAYGLLRTLERELWFLHSNILSSNHGHSRRA